ncbi:MAG TPA: hypothetical protein VND64_32845 [Pirellulales bacterium]|nr:hypothetical protein [Pirellulales bacterium]
MPDDETNPPRSTWGIRHARLARPLAACVASCLASLVAAWLWTTPQTAPRVPEAIVYEMLPAEPVRDNSAGPVLGALRSPEHLAAVLRSIGAAPRGEFAVASGSSMVERVRNGLRITTEVAPSGRQRVVAIRYVGGESFSLATALVNALANEYVSALRSNLEAQARGDLDSARSALAVAVRESNSARESLDSWLEARLAAVSVDDTKDQAGQGTAAAEVDLDPLPGEELKRELQQLHDRRESLLKRMTREHPDVQALDLEIADCRNELERHVVSPSDGPAETPAPLETPGGRRRSMTGERSVDRDAADAQWRSLRRAVTDAASRHAELAAGEDRAVERLTAARTTQIAKITPALSAEPAAVHAGWKNLVVVASFGMLAALMVNGAWPESSPRLPPRATVDSVAEFETEFGLPVLGMISLGSI